MPRRKVRWWKRRSLRFMKMKLIIIILALNILNQHINFVEKFQALPGIKRFATGVFFDGIKYRVKKYWFSG